MSKTSASRRQPRRGRAQSERRLAAGHAQRRGVDDQGRRRQRVAGAHRARHSACPASIAPSSSASRLARSRATGSSHARRPLRVERSTGPRAPRRRLRSGTHRRAGRARLRAAARRPRRRRYCADQRRHRPSDDAVDRADPAAARRSRSSSRAATFALKRHGDVAAAPVGIARRAAEISAELLRRHARRAIVAGEAQLARARNCGSAAICCGRSDRRSPRHKACPSAGQHARARADKRAAGAAAGRGWRNGCPRSARTIARPGPSIR